MDDLELKTFVKQQIHDSLGFLGDGLSAERGKALDYYHGRPLGDELEGRSQVVSRDVLETIQWIMPSLLRIFCGNDEYVQFDPVSKEDEQQAEQETAYVNHVLHSQNPGFKILHDWFHDALLMKTGVVTWYWEKDRKKINFERYSKLTDDEYTAIVSNDGVKIVEHEQYDEPYTDEERALIAQQDLAHAQAAYQQMAQQAQAAGQQPPPPQQPPEPPTSRTLHDILVKRTIEKAGECIRCVPPEDFLTERGARDEDSALFMGYRERVSVSDLKGMGFDKETIDRIAAGTDDLEGQGNVEEQKRDRFLESDNSASAAEKEKLTRKVWVYYLTMRVDYDDDGHAELRRIVYCCGEIAENDYTDEMRFATLCPLPTPHRLIGLSVADLVLDLQRIRSTLWRLSLDNMYLANNPQKGVVEGQVNIDDLLTPRVGGIVRMKAPGMMEPVTTPVFVDQTLELIQYTEQIGQQRTGVMKQSQGLDPDTLNKGAAGLSQLIAQADQRIEMIARIFAETGVKRLMRGIHSDLIKNQDEAAVIKLTNNFVEVNPSDWKERDNLTVTVGLGTGNKSQMIQTMDAIQNVMTMAIEAQTGVVQPKNLYTFGVKLGKLGGMKDADTFFTDPATLAPQQPQPSPEQIQAQTAIATTQLIVGQKNDEAKGKMIADQAQAQRDHQLELAKLELQRLELAQKENLAREEIASKERIAKYQADLKARTDVANAHMREHNENKRQARDAEMLNRVGSWNGSAPQQ